MKSAIHWALIPFAMTAFATGVVFEAMLNAFNRGRDCLDDITGDLP